MHTMLIVCACTRTHIKLSPIAVVMMAMTRTTKTMGSTSVRGFTVGPVTGGPADTGVMVMVGEAAGEVVVMTREGVSERKET